MAFSTGSPEGSRRVGTSLAEINIVPLVDVVLVLLLIFMLTAPMMYRGIDVNLPRAAAKPTAVEERMVLTVTKERALYLNDKRVPPGGLEGMLRDAFRNRTDKTVYLKADAGLAYGTVIETMDMVRRAGIERLGMVTEPARPAELPQRDAARPIAAPDMPPRARDAPSLPDRASSAPRPSATPRAGDKELPSMAAPTPTSKPSPERMPTETVARATPP